MTSAEATDDNTLVLTYSAPVANVLSNLQQLSILPQHVWEQFAVGDGKALRRFPNEPTDEPLVSGGPFVLAKYEKDQVAIFERNPSFYGTQPAIDGFGLQYFSNLDSMVAALRNGQIQAAITVPVTAVETLKGDSSLTVYNGPGITLRDFIINSSPEKTTNLELLDPKVRKAMEYAIDRNAIVETAWLGYAEPGSTIVAPGTGDWHDPQIQGLPFDIDQGEHPARSGRIHNGARRDPDRERAPDELHGPVRERRDRSAGMRRSGSSRTGSSRSASRSRSGRWTTTP